MGIGRRPAVVRPTSSPDSVPGLPRGEPSATVTANDSMVVSVPDAAALLRVEERLIYQLLLEGQLPELQRWSRRRLIPRRAVGMVVERTIAGYDLARALQAML